MKTLLSTILTCALVASSFAAETQTQKEKQAELRQKQQQQMQKQQQAQQQKDQQQQGQMQASGDKLKTRSLVDILGRPVKTQKGEQLGRISEVVVDLDEGRIAYAVMSFGGALGMGNAMAIVPWRSLQRQEEGNSYVLNIESQKMRQAPKYDKNNPEQTTDKKWGSDVHKFYGEKPYWEENQQEDQQEDQQEGEQEDQMQN